MCPSVKGCTYDFMKLISFLVIFYFFLCVWSMHLSCFFFCIFFLPYQWSRCNCKFLSLISLAWSQLRHTFFLWNKLDNIVTNIHFLKVLTCQSRGVDCMPTILNVFSLLLNPRPNRSRGYICYSMFPHIYLHGSCSSSFNSLATR